MYCREKAGEKGTYEFIDFRKYADAEGKEIEMLTVLKEDKKDDIIKAIEMLKKQISEKVLEKEIIKFENQIKMIEKCGAKK